MKTNEIYDKCFYIIGWIGIGALTVLWIIWKAGFLGGLTIPPCTLHSITGYYCPGCGGTRAVSALLAGHPLSATWYHPLVTYTVVIFGGFMLTQTLARLHIGGIKGWKFHEWHLYAAVAIMIGNFILKNILLLGFHISL